MKGFYSYRVAGWEKLVERVLELGVRIRKENRKTKVLAEKQAY
jgi:hypothetical protein